MQPTNRVNLGADEHPETLPSAGQPRGQGLMTTNCQTLYDAALASEPVDYAELIGRCMDSVDLAERILGRFEQSFENDLAELLEACRRRDGDRVAGIAHRMKGASANVSADGLTLITSELERLGRSRTFDDMGKWVTELHREWARFQQRPPLGEAMIHAAD